MASGRLTQTSIVVKFLKRNWNVDWKIVQTAILKEFPHSRFRKGWLPAYKRYILDGRIDFPKSRIPQEVRGGKLVKGEEKKTPKRKKVRASSGKKKLPTPKEKEATQIKQGAEIYPPETESLSEVSEENVVAKIA